MNLAELGCLIFLLRIFHGSGIQQTHEYAMLMGGLTLSIDVWSFRQEVQAKVIKSNFIHFIKRLCYFPNLM